MRLLAAFDSLGFPAIWFTFENGFKKIERPPHQAGGGMDEYASILMLIVVGLM
jgi:hypothetical protein